jgi:hypothetical protein
LPNIAKKTQSRFRETTFIFKEQKSIKHPSINRCRTGDTALPRLINIVSELQPSESRF